MKNEYQLDLFDFIIHKLSPFVSPDLMCFSPTGMRLRPFNYCSSSTSTSSISIFHLISQHWIFYSTISWFWRRKHLFTPLFLFRRGETFFFVPKQHHTGLDDAQDAGFGLSHLKCAASGIDVLLFYFDSRNPPQNSYTAKTQQISIFALDLRMYRCCYAYASASASATIQHSKPLVRTFSSYQFRVSSHQTLHFLYVCFFLHLSLTSCVCVCVCSHRM